MQRGPAGRLGKRRDIGPVLRWIGTVSVSVSDRYADHTESVGLSRWGGRYRGMSTIAW